MSKPTLHEIAAMPYPSSIAAMRKHYIHDWAKPIPEGSEKQTYAVTMRLTVTSSEHEIFDVDAWSEDEAIELAEDKAWKLYSHADDIDFEEVTAKVREAQQ